MRQLYKSTATSIFCLAIGSSAAIIAQDQTLAPFDKIKVGPRIELVLTEGDFEEATFEFDNINPENLNVEIKNGTLQLYLDHAKNLEKQVRTKTRYGKTSEGIYHNGRVVAHITYRSFNKLIVKGEERVIVDGKVNDQTFKLKVYGDSDITFEDLNADKLKVKLYGDTRLNINGGSAGFQKYTLYGDHMIDTHNFYGQKIKAVSFGESVFRANPEKFKITALGITYLNIGSDTHLRKFIIGESSVRRSAD